MLAKLAQPLSVAEKASPRRSAAENDAAETVQSKTEIDSPDNCCGHNLPPDDREVGTAIKHILGEPGLQRDMLRIPHNKPPAGLGKHLRAVLKLTWCVGGVWFVLTTFKQNNKRPPIMTPSSGGSAERLTPLAVAASRNATTLAAQNSDAGRCRIVGSLANDRGQCCERSASRSTSIESHGFVMNIAPSGRFFVGARAEVTTTWMLG